MFYIGLSAATVLVSSLMILSPAIALLAASIPIIGVLVWRKPALLIYFTVIAAITTLPSFVPTAVPVGGFDVRLYELGVIGSLAYAWTLPKPTGRSGAPYMLAALALASVLGYFFGNSAMRIIGDIRLPLELVAAYVIARRLPGTGALSGVLRLLPWTLWFSAVVSLAASAGFVEIGGTTEAAVLAGVGSGGEDAAVRLLSPATYAAVAVLCGCVALVVAGLQRQRHLWVFSVPSILIVVVSFTRNSVLAIAVSLVFAVLMARSADRVLVSALRVVGVAGAIWVALTLVGPLIPSLPGGAWVSQQAQSYSDRVINGLDSQTLEIDPSTKFRDAETDYLEDAIASNPMLGSGMGFPYKPPIGPEGSFGREYAPYYAHDFYLWMLVKAGVLGALLFVVPLVLPVLGVLRRSPTAATLATAPAAAGALAASFVAPMPLGSPTALIVGALVGFLSGQSPRLAPDRSSLSRRRMLRREQRKSLYQVEAVRPIPR